MSFRYQFCFLRWEVCNKVSLKGESVQYSQHFFCALFSQNLNLFFAMLAAISVVGPRLGQQWTICTTIIQSNSCKTVKRHSHEESQWLWRSSGVSQLKQPIQLIWLIIQWFHQAWSLFYPVCFNRNSSGARVLNLTLLFVVARSSDCTEVIGHQISHFAALMSF